MQQRKTKALTTGAMISALYGCLALLNTYTGSLLDIYFCYFMVFPLVYYGYQYGWKNNVLVAVASFFIMAIFGVPFYLVFGTGCLIQGVFLAEGMRRKRASMNLFIEMTLLAILKYVLIVTLFQSFVGIDFLMELKMMVQEMPAFLQDKISYQQVLSLLPVLCLCLSLIDTYCILAICSLVGRKFQISFPFKLSIIDFHLSKTYGFIALILLIAGYIFENNLFLNIRTFVCVIFALQGLSLLSYVLWVHHQVKYLLILVILMFVPYLNVLYIVLGIIDIFSDLREKIMYNKINRS